MAGIRIWVATLNSQGQLTGQTAYFYGVDGSMLAAYTLTLGSNLTASGGYASVYFGSKRVGVAPNGTSYSTFIQDRLGSQGSYYLYGEDKGTPLIDDQFKFATYWRDSATSLDYADQRYYTNNFGRFMTADPSDATPTSPSDPNNPQSWNRYSYVLDDPANDNDPSGLDVFYGPGNCEPLPGVVCPPGGWVGPPFGPTPCWAGNPLSDTDGEPICTGPILVGPPPRPTPPQPTPQPPIPITNPSPGTGCVGLATASTCQGQGGQPVGVVNCAKALAELVAATARLDWIIGRELAITGGHPNPKHAQKIEEALKQVQNAYNLVIVHCTKFPGAGEALANAAVAMTEALAILAVMGIVVGGVAVA